MLTRFIMKTQKINLVNFILIKIKRLKQLIF